MKRLFQSFALVLPLAVSAQVVKLEGAKVHQYKQVGGTKLFLHAFNPKGHKASDRLPAIVFFFGGGWNGGTPKQFEPHCAYLASRGMVAITAEYRVKSRNKTTPFECVKDGKSAIRWVRENWEWIPSGWLLVGDLPAVTLLRLRAIARDWKRRARI